VPHWPVRVEQTEPGAQVTPVQGFATHSPVSGLQTWAVEQVTLAHGSSTHSPSLQTWPRAQPFSQVPTHAPATQFWLPGHAQCPSVQSKPVAQVSFVVHYFG
jgi:hypothetical protein